MLSLEMSDVVKFGSDDGEGISDTSDDGECKLGRDFGAEQRGSLIVEGIRSAVEFDDLGVGGE